MERSSPSYGNVGSGASHVVKGIDNAAASTTSAQTTNQTSFLTSATNTSSSTSSSVFGASSTQFNPWKKQNFQIDLSKPISAFGAHADVLPANAGDNSVDNILGTPINSAYYNHGGSGSRYQSKFSGFNTPLNNNTPTPTSHAGNAYKNYDYSLQQQLANLSINAQASSVSYSSSYAPLESLQQRGNMAPNATGTSNSANVGNHQNSHKQYAQSYFRPNQSGLGTGTASAAAAAATSTITNTNAGAMISQEENTRYYKEKRLLDELKIKESQLTVLQNEYQKLYELSMKKEIESSSIFPINSEGEKVSTVQIPSHLFNIYQRLVENLAAKEKELEDTRTRFEAVLTAIALNPSKAVTKYGQYDEQAIAHKMITRLKTLTEENQHLSTMLSFGKAKEKDIQIGLLENENKKLKQQLKALEERLNNTDKS